MRRNLLLNIGLIGTACAAVAAVCAFIRHRSTYLHFETLFGRARVYQVEDDDGTPVRLLEVGGIVQSGTYLEERYCELVFEYLKRYDLMFCAQRPIRRIAVLGCGGYDYPEHIVAMHPEVTVDAVEIDPAITAIARRYFYLDRLIAEYDTETTGQLNLVCDDALAFLESGVERAEGSTAPHYDAIVNDTFDAGEPPAHLTGERFLRAAHARLVEGGLFMTNIVSPLEGPGAAFLDRQVELLHRVFAHVYVFPCSTDTLTEPDNVIVVATDSALPEELGAGSL